MLTIIEINARADGGHALQSQSGRRECWLDGYIAVPAHLEAAVWACCGYCDLDIRDGTLVGITAKEVPVVPEPDPEPTAQDDMDAMLVDHEYRLTLLELGVTEGVSKMLYRTL